MTDDEKVEKMFLINIAKYAQNKDLCDELLTTGTRQMKGGPSTWQWTKWNGLIQMMIRKKLMEGVDLKDVARCSLQELEKAGSIGNDTPENN